MSGFGEPSPDPTDMLVKMEMKEEDEEEEEEKCGDLQHDRIIIQDVDEKPDLEHSSLNCKEEILSPLEIKEEPDFGEYGDHNSSPSHLTPEMPSEMTEPTQPLVKTELKEEEDVNLLQQEHLNTVKQVKEEPGEERDLNTETATSSPTSAVTKVQKIHAGVKRHQCPVCQKRFRTPFQVAKHVPTHSDNKPHRCGDCGQRFKRLFDLTVHQRLHTGEKPYECTICKKRFRSSTYLAQHKPSHNEKDSYQCTVCGNLFKQKRSLTIHQKHSHGEDKPYPCGGCGKRFAYKFQANRHEKSHSDEKRYLCSECGCGFGQAAELRVHQRLHIQIFNHLANLEKHERIHHAE